MLKVDTSAPWTWFHDMGTGPGFDWKVRGFQDIILQAPLEQAVSIFSQLFSRDPWKRSCGCCGSDYNIYEIDEEERENLNGMESTLILGVKSLYKLGYVVYKKVPYVRLWKGKT